MAFSPTDACFEGFRLARREPASLALWAGYYFVAFTVVVAGAIMTVGFNALSDLNAGGGYTDPAQIARLLSVFFGIAAVAAPCLLIIAAILMCAVYRAVLRPEARAFAYLRLGADELRVLVVMLTLTILLGAAIGFPALGLVVATKALWPISHGGAALFAVFAGLALSCALAWAGVRLSLAYVDTFASRSIRIWESWSVTGPHFWPLLGMYALVALLVVVISIAGGVVQGAFQLLGVGAVAGAAFGHGNIAAAAPLLIVAGLGSVVVTVLVAVLQGAVIYAPQARAWRDLTGGGAASVF